VSDVVTDPWTVREPSANPDGPTRDEATERGQR
jgi:hypothetical protein